jgi:hypothetical protein
MRQGAVVEVFPQLGMLTKVDDDSCSLAGFVDDEADTRDHGSTSTVCVLASDAVREVVFFSRFRDTRGSLADFHVLLSCVVVGFRGIASP